MRASTGCSCSCLSSHTTAWTLISLAHQQTSPQMIFALCRSQPVGDQVSWLWSTPQQLRAGVTCSIPCCTAINSHSLVPLQTQFSWGWLSWAIKTPSALPVFHLPIQETANGWAALEMAVPSDWAPALSILAVLTSHFAGSFTDCVLKISPCNFVLASSTSRFTSYLGKEIG